MFDQYISRLYTLFKSPDEVQATRLVRKLIGVMGDYATHSVDRVVSALSKAGFDESLSALEGRKLVYARSFSGIPTDYNITTYYVTLGRQGDSRVVVNVGSETRCEG